MTQNNESDYGAIVEKDPAAIPIEENTTEEEEVEAKEPESCMEELSDIKWRMLPLICFLTFGGYYYYDAPGSIGTGKTGSIESLFLSKGKEFNSEMNQALYSIYSWPNTVVATIGGILIDNVIGLRKSLMLFITLVTIGCVIFWVGVSVTSYPVMMLGRFIFGLGNESLSVAQNSFVARYFRGKWGIALAFGIVLSFSRVGSSFNFLFSPRLAENVSVEFSCLVMVFACALSWGVSLLTCFVDLYCEKKALVAPEKIKKAEEGKASSFSLQDFKRIELRAWLIFIICLVDYIAAFCFVAVAALFMTRKYNVTKEEGATYVSFFQFACAGFSPITGAIVDASGYTGAWMTLAGLGFTSVHLLFILATPSPTGMMIYMGIVYSILASSLWPAVPFVVAPASLGFAYGIMNSVQNSGLALVPLVSGAILDSDLPPKPPVDGLCKNWTYEYNFDQKYLPDFPAGSLADCTNNTDAPVPYLHAFDNDLWLFAGTAFTGVLVAIALNIIDSRRDRILVTSAKERKQIYDRKIAVWKAEEKQMNLGTTGDVAAVEDSEQDNNNNDNNNQNEEDERTRLLSGRQGDVNASPQNSNQNLGY